MYGINGLVYTVPTHWFLCSAKGRSSTVTTLNLEGSENLFSVSGKTSLW